MHPLQPIMGQHQYHHDQTCIRMLTNASYIVCEVYMMHLRNWQYYIIEHNLSTFWNWSLPGNHHVLSPTYKVERDRPELCLWSAPDSMVCRIHREIENIYLKMVCDQDHQTSHITFVHCQVAIGERKKTIILTPSDANNCWY